MKEQGKKKGSPYKVLYWLGFGVLLLLVGVLWLAMRQKDSGPISGPRRTIVWLYDEGDKGGPAAMALIEEPKENGTTIAVPLNAPPELREVYKASGSRKVMETTATKLGRGIHDRLFLPYSVAAKLIDAAAGITVGGKQMNGQDAVQFIKSGDAGAMAERATTVLLALGDSADRHGLSIGVSEGLRLVNQVDTNIDLSQMQDRMAGWTKARVQLPPATDWTSVQSLFQPDPPEQK